MATSSIFHQLVIDTDEKARRFVKALKAAEKDAKEHPFIPREDLDFTPEEEELLKKDLEAKFGKK